MQDNSCLIHRKLLYVFHNKFQNDIDEIYETNNTYEELLQDGRYKLKEFSVKYREQSEKIKEYRP